MGKIRNSSAKRYGLQIALFGASIGLLQYFKQGYGSTASERQQLLPGDELILQASSQTTHAITIPASAGKVWPWLLQVGYHRGGWYIDSWWDRWLNENFWPLLVPRDHKPVYKPSADEILPEWQNLAVGDTVPDGPPESAFFTVTNLEAGKVLVLYSTTHIPYMTPPFLNDTLLQASGDFSWVFVLRELPGKRTRLLLRMRGTFSPALLRYLSLPLIVIVDYLFTRQMLLGIKHRVVFNQVTDH